MDINTQLALERILFTAAQEPEGSDLRLALALIDQPIQPVSGWQKFWVPIETPPKPFEIVVVTTQHGGMMPYAWMEPTPAGPSFSEEHGSPRFWMAKDTFEAVAPEWARKRAEPLSEEAITEHSRRSQGLTCVARPLSGGQLLASEQAERLFVT
jgi:hypothetical protein